MPRRVFGRLVIGLSLVSSISFGLSMSYLYFRFHSTNSLFYEGSMHGFIAEIIKDFTVRDGRVTVAVPDTTVRRITQNGGRFIILDAEGHKLAASSDVDAPFIAFDDATVRYFWLPSSGGTSESYGMSARIPGLPQAIWVQLVFPKGSIVFDTILHVFMKEIAWLWMPLPLLMLATNIIVVRVALRPLAHAVKEAEAIQPGGVSVLLSERDLPEDLLALVRAVNQAIGRLREGYRAQEEFAGDIAHELRTPLAVMKLQLATLEGPHARVLERDLRGMERLVEQLIDRARLGRFHLEPGDVVELNEVAREAAAFLGPTVISRGRMIEVLAARRSVRVDGGRDDVFRAIRNLIENALEHSPPGGLISVEITEAAAVSVMDHGPGFPPHVLDEERRRSAPLRSDRRTGAGLGLAIVERTMQAHGGRLELSNSGTGGGCATLLFPSPSDRSA